MKKKIKKGKRIGILFGPEASGLSNDDLQYCHSIVSLPTHQNSSLNLSQAVGAFGTHLMNSIQETPPTPKKYSINMLFQQRVISSSMQVLQSIQYMNGRNPQQIQNNLLRLIERAQPTDEELKSLIAMSNKIFHGIRVLKEQISKQSDESQKK